MNEIFEFLNNNYTFKIVLLGCSLLAIISSIVGNFAVLKKESLLADGVSHASLAGVCLAFLITKSSKLYILLLGAFFISIICIYLIDIIQKNTKVKFDSIIALFLTTFFGVGLVLLSYLKKIPGAKKAGLNKFIFGQASTLLLKDIYLIIGISVILLVIILIFWKEIKISIFDKEYAKTLGIDSEKIGFLVSFIIIVNIIVGVQIAGVILITSMMIIPSVAARQWSNRLNVIVILSIIFSLISSFVGVTFSSLNSTLPTGPLIVIVLSSILIISLLFSHKRGILKNKYISYIKNREIKKKYGDKL